MVPCVIQEDEHLLVVNKPVGLNTHAASPFASEGIYDWLRHREPHWAKLAIVQRLDKETSGVLLFTKTPLANRSLTEQLTRHEARKRYVFLTDRPMPEARKVVRSNLVRTGDKYLSQSLSGAGVRAETHFERLELRGNYTLVAAKPITGRTHQIRVHAAESGMPILGDTMYGGTPAERVFLHAEELIVRHPATHEEIRFHALVPFETVLQQGPSPATVGVTSHITHHASPSRLALRTALIDSAVTNAYRLLHGASDGWPGAYVDRLGEYLLIQAEAPLTPTQEQASAELANLSQTRGVLFQRSLRRPPSSPSQRESVQRVLGNDAPQEWIIRENNLLFALRRGEGSSVGLFLDQRDNRRRLLVNHVAADFPVCDGGLQGATVLNTFAYTCGFSVAAAKAGARVTSVDLSRKYLDWGRHNFTLNDLDHTAHEFLYGDVFDWLRRFSKKARQFDVVLLDPPTFSKSKSVGVFQAEKNYGRLIEAAQPLVKPAGVLFASSNAARWPAEDFLTTILQALRSTGRVVQRQHYVPQPPDFPISRDEPAYLKTVWLRLEG